MSEIQLPKPDSYTAYLHQKRQRETKLFTYIGVIMVSLFVLSVLVFTNILPVPFLNSFSEGPKYAQVGSIPCLSNNETLKPSQVKVNVLNGTNVPGLAGKTKEGLDKLGFKVTGTGNSYDLYENDAKITAGPTGITAAYTLALAFKNPVIILDSRVKDDVSVVLGKNFANLTPEKEFKNKLELPLENLPKCLKVKVV